jgi:hypothetical protein
MVLSSSTILLRPSLSGEFFGAIFGTIHRTSNCTTNRAKTSSKTRYDFGGFCTILWYDLRYHTIRLMSDVILFISSYGSTRPAKLLPPPRWPPPPPRCHRHAATANAAAALPTPPTPCSCQAAASTVKLVAAANAALLPSCRHRRQAGRCPRAVTALPPPPPSPSFPLLSLLLS